MKHTAVDLLKWARKELEHSHVPSAGKDAEAIFAHSFNMRRENIYAMKAFTPEPVRKALFRHSVRLRASRFPLQYILKNTDFMGLTFSLEEGVFIPRPETELLVEKILGIIGPMRKSRVNILEIGTGCGNIAISLTKMARGCKIIVSDVSRNALDVAEKNARAHRVKKDIKFVQSNYFDKISAIYYNYFDIIVSNPPYVIRSQIKTLQPEIAYEDIKALDGGADGIYAYRRILSEGTRYLKRGGALALEIGYNRRTAIERLLKNDGRFFKIDFYKDYNGYDRILIAKKRRGTR